MSIKKKQLHNNCAVIRKDICRGFYSNRFKYPLIILTIAGMYIMLGSSQFGFLDVIFFMQSGYEPVVIFREGKVFFPVVWIAVQFMTPFLIYSYCNDDCEGIGLSFLVKCRSRRLWWNGKCLWNFLTVISYYAIEYTAAFIIGLLNKKTGWEIDYELFMEMSNKPLPDNEDSVYIIIYLLVMPVIVSLIMSLFQMILAIFTNPMIGMLAVMSLNVMSVFIYSPLMPGNLAMTVRSSVYRAGRIDAGLALILCVIVYALIYTAGIELFKKKNFISKENTL